MTRRTNSGRRRDRAGIGSETVGGARGNTGPSCAQRSPADPTETRRGLEEPNALRWRTTFRCRASRAARSAICAGTALDVNGDRDTSPVASHAAAEVTPPIPTVSPRPVLLSWLGAHVASTCILGATLAWRNRSGYCVAGMGDAVRPNSWVTTTCPGVVVAGSTREAALPQTTAGRVFTIST